MKADSQHCNLYPRSSGTRIQDACNCQKDLLFAKMHVHTDTCINKHEFIYNQCIFMHVLKQSRLGQPTGYLHWTSNAINAWDLLCNGRIIPSFHWEFSWSEYKTIASVYVAEEIQMAFNSNKQAIVPNQLVEFCTLG